MSTIKLYTEEQVKIAIKDAYLSGIERPIDFGIVDESIINSLIPIELPTDEEIEKEAEKYPYGGREGSKRKAFIEGVEWMRDRIQGGMK